MSKRENGIVKIHVYELHTGMCVCRLEMLEKESPFLFDRFDIKTQADILEILHKPGKLDDDELEIMRKHPEFGHDILMAATSIVQDAVDVAYGHHEHLSGTGYPRGVDKTELSIFTKIVAVVDAYDAITSDRVYQRQVASFGVGYSG